MQDCATPSTKPDLLENNVKFEGTGPYYLRTIEHAIAGALGTTIQVTLFASVENRTSGLVQIQTQMTPWAAEELANALLRASRASDSPSLFALPNATDRSWTG